MILAVIDKHDQKPGFGSAVRDLSGIIRSKLGISKGTQIILVPFLVPLKIFEIIDITQIFDYYIKCRQGELK